MNKSAPRISLLFAALYLVFQIPLYTGCSSPILRYGKTSLELSISSPTLNLFDSASTTARFITPATQNVLLAVYSANNSETPLQSKTVSLSKSADSRSASASVTLTDIPLNEEIEIVAHILDLEGTVLSEASALIIIAASSGASIDLTLMPTEYNPDMLSVESEIEDPDELDLSLASIPPNAARFFRFNLSNTDMMDIRWGADIPEGLTWILRGPSGQLLETSPVNRGGSYIGERYPPSETGYHYFLIYNSTETILSGLSFIIKKTIHPVSFQLNGGISPTGNSESYVSYEVRDNSLISVPETPSRSGYQFAGWYADEALSIAWNFETNTVTSDTVLYAKWEEEDSTPLTININFQSPETYTLSIADGTAVLSQSGRAGIPSTMAVNPVGSFASYTWTLDGQSTHAGLIISETTATIDASQIGTGTHSVGLVAVSADGYTYAAEFSFTVEN